MKFGSLKNLFAEVALVTAERFDELNKAWRIASESGSPESLLEFICRESGIGEEAFLQQLARVLGWPFLQLKSHTIPTEARNKISTKVAFQYSVLPTNFENHTLQVAISNPFDMSMLSAVQFDAKTSVQFALAPKAEIEKALKKYYGVGAETLDELSKDEPMTRKSPKATRKPA